MKYWKTLFALCLLLPVISTKTDTQVSSASQGQNRMAAQESGPLFGCIYTCTRTGTATDASSICSATHVTVTLDVSIKSERNARSVCRDSNSEGFKSATRFCVGGSRRCNPPSASNAVVILNRALTDADKRAIQGYSS